MIDPKVLDEIGRLYLESKLLETAAKTCPNEEYARRRQSFVDTRAAMSILVWENASALLAAARAASPPVSAGAGLSVEEIERLLRAKLRAEKGYGRGEYVIRGVPEAARAIHEAIPYPTAGAGAVAVPARHFARRSITGDMEIVDREFDFVRAVLPYDYRFTCNADQWEHANRICAALEGPMSSLGVAHAAATQEPASDA